MEKTKKIVKRSNTYENLTGKYEPEQPLAVRKILTAQEKNLNIHWKFLKTKNR